jgi:hypothetical protein
MDETESNILFLEKLVVELHAKLTRL